MPQVSRSTSNAIYSLPDTFANYRNLFNTGNIIFYANVTNLVTIYNAYRSHYHSVYDEQYIAYGNTYTHATANATINTTTINPGLPAAFAAPSAPQGSKIFSSTINTYITRITGLPLTHRHRIVDTFY